VTIWRPAGGSLEFFEERGCISDDFDLVAPVRLKKDCDSRRADLVGAPHRAANQHQGGDTGGSDRQSARGLGATAKFNLRQTVRRHDSHWSFSSKVSDAQ